MLIQPSVFCQHQISSLSISRCLASPIHLHKKARQKPPTSMCPPSQPGKASKAHPCLLTGKTIHHIKNLPVYWKEEVGQGGGKLSLLLLKMFPGQQSVHSIFYIPTPPTKVGTPDWTPGCTLNQEPLFLKNWFTWWVDQFYTNKKQRKSAVLDVKMSPFFSTFFVSLKENWLVLRSFG